MIQDIIVWVSSREGLATNPFTGIYAASKEAVEAIAETMSMELQEFGVEVPTVNPGPFLTGFNDRGIETWKSWEDDPSQRLYDYSTFAFPRAQFDPEAVYATLTAVAADEVDTYRNLVPKSMLEETSTSLKIHGTRRSGKVSALELAVRGSEACAHRRKRSSNASVKLK